MSTRTSILVVEDQPALLGLLGDSLRLDGHEVFEASRPTEAMQHGLQHTEPIALLVTDVVMPEMSGPDLARNLATQHPDMRVLFISGHPTDLVRSMGAFDGRATFLAKPFSLSELSDAVSGALAGTSATTPEVA